MSATTIKLEDPLLHELKKIIPKDTSLTAFIREVLESDLRRRKMIGAAEAYARFLDSNPEEAQWLKDWEAADLTGTLKPAQRKKSEKR